MTFLESLTLFQTYNGSGIVIAALSLLQRIFNNILAHPADNKFRRLNLESSQLTENIMNFRGGKQMLKACGFSEPVFDPNIRKHVIVWSNLKSHPLSSLEKQRISTILREITDQLKILNGGPALITFLNQLRKTHCISAIVNIFQTAHQIVSNIASDPDNFKVKRIKKNNKLFLTTLGSTPICDELMNSIGFFESGEHFYQFQDAQGFYILLHFLFLFSSFSNHR
jgi:hypothetical protein